MKRLLMLVAIAACGGKATPPPSNAKAADPVAPVTAPASTPAKCGGTTCVDCIADGCQWDINKKACAEQCAPDATNCLSFGVKTPTKQQAGDVCATARQ